MHVDTKKMTQEGNYSEGNKCYVYTVLKIVAFGVWNLCR
jgi:hypothetical protein